MNYDNFDKAVKDFSKRLKFCVEAGDGQFEHSQWQWNFDILSVLNCVVQTMLLNWCYSLNIFITGKLVGGQVKKSIISPFLAEPNFTLQLDVTHFSK